jgi:hypothetical protein
VAIAFLGWLIRVRVLIVAQLHDGIPAPAFWAVLAAAAGWAQVLGLLGLRQAAKYRRLANPY